MEVSQLVAPLLSGQSGSLLTRERKGENRGRAHASYAQIQIQGGRPPARLKPWRAGAGVLSPSLQSGAAPSTPSSPSPFLRRTMPLRLLVPPADRPAASDVGTYARTYTSLTRKTAVCSSVFACAREIGSNGRLRAADPSLARSLVRSPLIEWAPVSKPTCRAASRA